MSNVAYWLWIVDHLFRELQAVKRWWAAPIAFLAAGDV
jgi:hypothetical protein